MIFEVFRATSTNNFFLDVVCVFLVLMCKFSGFSSIFYSHKLTTEGIVDLACSKFGSILKQGSEKDGCPYHPGDGVPKIVTLD